VLPVSEPESVPPLSEDELVLAPLAEKERETEPAALGPVESAEQATRLAPSVLTVAKVTSRSDIGVLLECWT
jgi:hypothetical protein